jgi:hypothetical protein
MTTVTAEKVDLLKSKLKGQDTHGDVVIWTLTNTQYDVHDLLAAIAKCEIKGASIKDLRLKSAFLRAIRELKGEMAIDDVSDKNIVSFQFSHKEYETVDGLKRVKHAYNYQMCLHENGNITCTHENADVAIVISDMVKDRLAAIKCFRSAAEVSRMIKGLFKDNGDIFSIDEEKGVAYFVPAQCYDFLDKVELFVSEIGGKLTRLPIVKGDSTGDGNVRDVMSKGLKKMYKELEASVEGWDDSTRKSTMKKRIEDFHTLNYKISVYADHFEDQAKELRSKADEVKRTLTEKITALGV